MISKTRETTKNANATSRLEADFDRGIVDFQNYQTITYQKNVFDSYQNLKTINYQICMKFVMSD
jgi:hypothetical protein